MSLELDIRQWLVALSLRCVPRTTENLEVIAKDYATGLADLPREAFSPASREEAARRWDSFPSYKMLREFLEEWWEAHRPRPKMLPTAVDDAPLDPESRAWARNWLRHASGDWGISKDGTKLTGTSSDLFNQLARLRQMKPNAFAWLILNDTYASGMAARAGWDDQRKRRGAPTDDELAATALSAATAISALHASRIPEPAAQPPPSGQLTPEQLAATRRAAGIILPVAPQPPSWD